MFYKILLSLICFFTLSIAAMDIKNLDTFKAEFTQNIKSTSGKAIEYKGEVFIKKDGKILWKYKTPIIKNVYIINNFAIVDEPELEQAIYTELQSEINIIKLLKNAQKINENIYMATVDNVDYLIETVNKKELIKNIKYKDKLDNNVIIDFSNALVNSEINDELFLFTAPDYYDIIKK